MRSMSLLFLSIFSLFSFCLAQSSTVVTLLFVSTHLEASVIKADKAATTYSMNCPADNSTCLNVSGITGQATIVEGSSTAAFTIRDSKSSVAIEINCKVTGTSEAVCGETASAQGSSTAITATLSGSNMIYGAVNVTAGLDKLASASSTPGNSGVVNAPPALGAKMGALFALFFTTGAFMILL